MTREEEIAALRAENATLRERVEVLAAQVQELQARLAKDSRNSSKPPASDGLARKSKSLRQPSGMKPGGQLGHRGQTLRLVATPDAVVEHRPTACDACRAPLDGAPIVGRERRQVHELPPVRLRHHRTSGGLPALPGVCAGERGCCSRGGEVAPLWWFIPRDAQRDDVRKWERRTAERARSRATGRKQAGSGTQ